MSIASAIAGFPSTRPRPPIPASPVHPSDSAFPLRQLALPTPPSHPQLRAPRSPSGLTRQLPPPRGSHPHGQRFPPPPTAHEASLTSRARPRSSPRHFSPPADSGEFSSSSSGTRQARTVSYLANPHVPRTGQTPPAPARGSCETLATRVRARPRSACRNPRLSLTGPADDTSIRPVGGIPFAFLAAFSLPPVRWVTSAWSVVDGVVYSRTWRIACISALGNSKNQTRDAPTSGQSREDSGSPCRHVRFGFRALIC